MLPTNFLERKPYYKHFVLKCVKGFLTITEFEQEHDLRITRSKDFMN